MQAMLVNGKVYWEDCVLIGGLNGAGNADYQTTCNVTDYEILPGQSLVTLVILACIFCIWQVVLPPQKPIPPDNDYSPQNFTAPAARAVKPYMQYKNGMFLCCRQVCAAS